MYKFILPFILYLSMTACDVSHRIVYMQDIPVNEAQPIDSGHSLTIQPGDMLSIVVSSKDPELAALFNLPRISYEAGTNQTGSYNNQISGYTVDPKGNIDFPNVGPVHIAGLTRSEIAEVIKQRLIGGELLKDPVITVDYMNLSFSVLGEVARPGSFNITKDQITLLEALGQAGDLTIYGRRDRVLLTREENGRRTTYRVDLRSADLFNSPAYYVRQNDVVYVEPNKVRAGQSTVNANNVKSVSLWTSIASLLTSISVLIFK